MQYNKILRNYPMSKYREQALFALGEYYFQLSGFEKSGEAFREFLDQYPDSEGKIHVLAYLLSIAREDHDVLLTEELEKQVVSLENVSLVFRDSKEFVYKSPLYKNHKAVVHIDKIEFYVEGEFFAKVSY